MLTTRNQAVLCVALLLGVSPALAQWTQVGPGIEYRHYSVSGPNQVFVTRMDRGNLDCIIESGIAMGRWRSGLETVRNMANRYQDAINFWGENWGNRNQVVVAINGSFLESGTQRPASGLIQSGSYDKRFTNVGGQSGFAWKLDRSAFIGECVTHMNHKQIVRYANNTTQEFRAINLEPGSNELVVFTPNYDTNTGTDNTVSEVLVELDRPFLLMPTPASVSGVVRQIRVNQGSTVMPFDCVVLSASGSAATTMLNNVSVGDTIRFSQEIYNFNKDCVTPRALDWTKTFASISGNLVFLMNGDIQWNVDPTGAVHPRTAIALNDTHVFFVVVDGRQSGYSVGMTINALASFCKDMLGATWGVNQDGGGSSTMWINGTVVNRPSDGTERPVANGMMMVVVQSKQLSSHFQENQGVRTLATATARLGPGDNYASLATVPAATEGTVLAHALQGVRAKGTTWWKCQFGSTVGWFDEALLEATEAPVPEVPDFDGDGDVDLEDFSHLQKCFTGPTVPYSDPACGSADLDNDDDVDAADFSTFQGCFSGPDQSYEPECTQ